MRWSEEALSLQNGYVVIGKKQDPHLHTAISKTTGCARRGGTIPEAGIACKPHDKTHQVTPELPPMGNLIAQYAQPCYF